MSDPTTSRRGHRLTATVTAFAPGRVNLIGEHTDYNDGLALPFAIGDGVTVRAVASGSELVEVTADDLGAHDTFELGAPGPAPGWRAFARGAVAELAREGLALTGVRLQITGTVPRGSGLSSSAALEVALCLALLGAADGPVPEPLALARICSRIENDWIGAQTGLLDQLASLCGQPEHALRIDFRDLTVVPVVLELGDWTLVTLDSGQSHAHATTSDGGDYNARRTECTQARQQLGLASLRDATEDLAATLAWPLRGRVEHVIGENARVEATIAALRDHDLMRVGALIDASHESLRDLFEVSTPAVEAAVARLRDAGAAGARIVGGGFGGHVLGLFPPDATPPSDAMAVRPGSGAHVLA